MKHKIFIIFVWKKKKEKNVKQKNMRKWKLFFIVLAKEEAPGKKKSSQKKIPSFSSFVANVCSLQQQGESTINSF